MMNELPQIQISFFFSGDKINLEEVTKKMNIIPTFSREKDDFPIKEIARTCWALDMKKESSKAVSIQFKKIINVLENKVQIIKSIHKEYNCDIGFLINIWMENGNRPEIVLTKEINNFVSSINAEVGFDLFID